MLKISNLSKDYYVDNKPIRVLEKINVEFRENEFVSILGPSGSGKTTLLNIIGGLDRYTEGDLIIDNISTKKYKNDDWDAYRNHRVGFVFQSYNLISHLDILSNVELALTLTGIDRKTRVEKAKEALTKVGLEDHLYKKPNQLSGGQMQRVAIARALVNDPTIILADEPTGALDSKTSLEVMELLKEISKDKLIIMVTHNEELALKYSNRIVSLLDGKIVDDSNPIKKDNNKNELLNKKDRTAMSFFTALSLSFKNLLTKKVRTLITALAGSIGIIGVALVMSLQFGFNKYLTDMERGTFAGMPIQVNRSYFDIDIIMNGSGNWDKPKDPVQGGVGGYDPEINMGISTNTLTEEYKTYLDNSNISEYGSIVYNYGYKGKYFYYDQKNNELNFNPQSTSPIPGLEGRQYVTQSPYTIEFLNEFFMPIAGQMYNNNANEAVLIVNEEHQVPNKILKFLGFDITENQVVKFEDIINKEFKIYTNNVYYNEQTNGLFKAKSETELISSYNDTNNINVKIVGIIKSSNEFMQASEAIIYSENVANTYMEVNNKSNIVLKQKQNKNKSVLTGRTITDEQYLDLIYELGGNSTPTSILIYPNGFDEKEYITEILDNYNKDLPKEEKINYSDNIAIAVSMMKTVMNSISVVLIAFSAISLVVSSVMIGIITYTSVLERTKEIGVLRSIGARKKDISRVFNAEAILIGGLSGLLGVLIAYILVPILNRILFKYIGINNLAQLFILHALGLILLSILLTFIAGLIPSKIASNKDPVVALRTE